MGHRVVMFGGIQDENGSMDASKSKKIGGQHMTLNLSMPGQEDLIFLGATMMMLDPGGDADSGQHVGALLGMISIRRNAANVFEAF